MSLLTMIAEHASSFRNTLFLTLTIYILRASLIATTSAEGSPLAVAATPVTLHCTGSPAWLAPEFAKEDCLEAGVRLEYSDFALYGNQRVEFTNRGTRRRTRLPQINTPRRYTIATCTIVVALLWDFPDQPPLPPLPGEMLPAGPFERNVVISFQDIFNSAQRLLTHCFVKPRTPIGWEALTRGGSIGVFVMATESLLASSIPIERHGIAGTEHSLNFTTPFGNSTATTS